MERKADTRQKIQLGGLVKQAGLAELKTAELLGLLLEASEQLQPTTQQATLSRWRSKGELALGH